MSGVVLLFTQRQGRACVALGGVAGEIAGEELDNSFDNSFEMRLSKAVVLGVMV
ncbi:hypothetical protein [Nostoc sp.]|uniref:hypothetical protein n=1 Tax=Nostoc sp. TaxID=1180 RepID=UPI002FFBE4CE